MAGSGLRLTLLKDRLAVCRLEADADYQAMLKNDLPAFNRSLAAGEPAAVAVSVPDR